MTTYDEHLDAAVTAAQDAARAATSAAAGGGGGGGGGTITSVNGQTGPAVTLAASDVGAVPTTRTVNGKALSADIALTNTDVGAAATSHTHPASQISDSTTTGRALLTAADAATARTAIGAGTSSLAIGTTGTTAAAGNDSRLSDSRTPSGSAGGDLSGTYPNPTVAKVGGVAVTGTPTSGQVITATSGTAASWATPSGGGGGAAFAGRHLAGCYQFNAASNGSYNEAFTTTAGTLYAIPFWVGVTCTYDRLITRIGTAGGAGSVLRVGIYNVASTGVPGTLVLDAGTIDTSTTGGKSLTISQSLTAGVYFVVCVSSSSTTQMWAIGSAPNFNPLGWFGSPIDNEVSRGYLTATGYTAASALPSTATTAGLTPAAGDIPVITLRAA